MISKVAENALIAIKDSGLNHYRCYLTGAPYASIFDAEIAYALESELTENPFLSTERLVDIWQLRALSFNTQILPSLRGVNESSLLHLMTSGLNGQVKAMTYFLTRLLFPHLGAEPLASEIAKERMLFSSQLFDLAMTWDYGKVSMYSQHLVAIDSYCSMPLWHTMWAFESQLSKYGVANSPKRVRQAFADPVSVLESEDVIAELINYMHGLMIHVTETDGVLGRSGNRLAQKLLLIQAAAVPQLHIPAHQKRGVSEADMIRIENRRRLDSRPELRVAYSAINGKGHKPGEGAIAHAARMMAEGKNVRVKTETTAQAAREKAKTDKPKTLKVDSAFASAFAAVLNKNK